MLVTLSTFMGFYCPQPLLASLAQDFGVSQTFASLLMTVVIFPFAIAPFFYGRILSKINLRFMLMISLVGSGTSLCIAAISHSFIISLIFRTIQGILLPAILLCLTTRISSVYSGIELQNKMAFYSSMTLFGAYGGRILSGIISTSFSSESSLFVFGIVQIISLIPAFGIAPKDIKKNYSFNFSNIKTFIQDKNILNVLFIGPVCILSYSSILNFIPFHMYHINNSISNSFIGWSYISGIFGALVVLLSPKFIKISGNIFLFLIHSSVLFAISLLLFLINSIYIAVIGMLFSSILFSLIYSNCPGLVNMTSTSDKSVTNSIYLGIYYLSSAIGSIFPIYIYSSFGIFPFVMMIFFISILNCMIIYHAKNSSTLHN